MSKISSNLLQIVLVPTINTGVLFGFFRKPSGNLFRISILAFVQITLVHL